MQPKRNFKTFRGVALSLILMTAALGTRAAWGAPPAAGTAITNTATGSYVDSTSGLSVRLTSNTVAVVVQPLEALTLTNNQTLNVAPSNTFALPHTLTNTGNVATAYALSFSVAGGSVAPTGLEVVEDANGNGIADPGEPVLAGGATLTLAPGAAMNLLLVGTMPASATAGEAAQLKLTAKSQVQGATASNIDTVNVVNGPAIVLTKSASSTAPVPNALLTYTLSATNSGLGVAGPIAVSVNGIATSLVVVRDAIPANTTFASATAISPGAQLLYHRLGDPLNLYSTTPSLGTGTGVDGVAFAAPSLAAAASLAGSFTVTVNANAAGTLSNVGYADFFALGANATVSSNPVQLSLPALAPTIRFYTTSTYATPTQQAVLASPLYVQVNAAACNTNPDVVVTHPITLTSTLTGDIEMYTATETAPNTGMFRILPSVPTASAAVHVVAAGDGILEVLPNDRVTATLSGCGVTTTSAAVLIDPSGTVFNSKTNAPVAGATVELVDVSGAGNGGHSGAAAAVFAGDGVTPAPNPVVTQVDGSYSFPFVPASSYKIVVTPPNGLVFPSKLPPGLLPPGRNISAPASYGGQFTLTTMGSALTVDIPLDSGAAGGLYVQKLASKPTAALGDFVDYAVTVSNNTGIALPGIVLNDALPIGFAYVSGSSRLNAVPLTNPVGGAGPALVFGVGTLAPGTQALLTYRVRIGPAAQSGSGTNTAVAVSGATQSNLASVTVKVSSDSALSTSAYVFGKVYADCNADRVQNDAEPGIPGVRIYLDDGTYAVTDIEGKYSLYGLTPRTHVAKLDATTLPPGARLEILDNRNARDAGSRFVDLHNGELQKADFAVSGCSDGLRADLSARKLAQKDARQEITTAATSQIQLNPTAVADPRTLAASGVIGQRSAANAGANGGGGAASGGGGGAAAAAGAIAPGAARGAVLPDSLETLLPRLSPSLDFLNLIDGGIVTMAQTRVRVKGAYGAQLKLAVNGREIGLDQVGERSSLESRGVTAWEYIGVDLDPGENTLVLTMVDSFGNTRGSKTLHLLAPGPLAKIALTAPAEGSADVQTPVDVTVELQDERGIPVHARTAITLEASLGEWQTPDLDPKEPGTQVFIEGGVAHFKLLPPSLAGRSLLKVSGGKVRAEASITFMPNLRPMIAAGFAEGVLSLHNLSPSSLVQSQSGDSFEREIQSASASFDDGKGSVAGRASLFLKGKILGSDLLTMSFDSDKPNDVPLFRDIQPDQFYPVYGDSSVKGFDAQSTGKLYVRIDHGTSYGVYGDYSTQSDNPARVLTQYTRALNGVKTHVEDGNFTFEGFASYTSSTQVIDELPANGTSGPYQLSQRNPVLNSQRVDIITRDRNQPSLVLADTPLSQFTDYAVEPFSGQILFKASIPSLDPNLNPIYIRVVYEVNSGGPNYWVGGVDAREKLTSDFTVGGTAIRDSNPVSRETLGGANFLWAPNKGTTVVGEAAESSSDLAGTGGAHRLELKHTDDKVQARIYGVQTDASFDNASSTYTAGASEYGAKVSAAFDAQNRLLIEAIKTTTAGNSIQSPLSIPVVGVPEAIPGGGRREGESIAFEHTLPYKIKVTAGVRHADSNGVATQALAIGGVPTEFTSARVRVDTPVPGLPRATMFAQYEQSVDDPTLKDTTLGATYQLAPQTKFYATHQTSDSLSGDYALNAGQQNDLTVVGIDTTYMKDGKMFDEYRLGDGIDGRDAQAAVGLRNLWTLVPGLGLSTSLQEVHPISGVVTDTAKALTAALQWTGSQNWKASTRVEWSQSETAQTWLSSVGAALKINADITGLARGIYNEQLSLTPGTGSIYLRQEQLGFAYRPVDNDVWNALAWVEHKRSLNGTLGTGLDVDESADIFSTHVNYQISPDWVINGRYGIKRAADFTNGITSYYTAQIVGGRSVWDLNSRWDVGLQYFIETGDIGNSHQQAVGGEVGYLVVKNMWLSIGYNLTGFRDQDLASEDYTQREFYLRLRVKFDENLFKPKNNAEALPANAAVMK